MTTPYDIPMFTPADQYTDPPAASSTASDDTPPETGTETKEPRKINLGGNKKRGSGVRALNKDDIAQLQSYYESIAFFMMLFNREAATACAERAQVCAEAWAEVAAQNDSVRKTILALVEGGAWGKLIMAHIPIILPFIPPAMLDKIPGYAMMRQQANGVPMEDTVPV